MADGAQLARCTGKPAVPPTVYGVAIICDCINARVRTDLKRICCRSKFFLESDKTIALSFVKIKGLGDPGDGEVT